MRASSIPLLLAGALAACGSPAGPGVDADQDRLPDDRDCAPGDATRWMRARFFVDADGDGKGVGEGTVLCVGAEIPRGYAAVAGDCDDGDPARFDTWTGYADDDADGVGAGALLTLCAGARPPRLLAGSSGDCAPDDAGRWRELGYLERDADGDGVTTASAGTVCAGDALPHGYAVVASGADCDDADGSRWLTIDGFADADGDGVGDGPRVTLCTDGAIPAGYSGRRATAPRYYTGPLSAEPDCDDGDPAVWEVRPAHADVDGDGVGAGAPAAVCAGTALPSGFVTGPADDCAPEDGAAWRSWAYAYRDADGDGTTIAAAGTLCIGAAPPAGYATAPSGSDCDDADPRVWASVVGFADGDGDGVGAPPAITSCTDGALPAGQVASASDCAPADASRWQRLAASNVDADGDGATAPIAAAEVCSGAALPDPYRATSSGRDCDDADASVWRALVRYRDQDRDGVGATPRTIFCVGTDDPGAEWSRFGWDVDDADAAWQWDEDGDDLVNLDVL